MGDGIREGRSSIANERYEAAAFSRVTIYGGGQNGEIPIVSTGGSFLDSPVDSDVLTVFALP